MQTPIIAAAMCLLFVCAAARAQDHNRIISPEDIVLESAAGGGILIRARVWLANHGESALEMGTQVSVWIGNQQLGSVAEARLVAGTGGGTGSCLSQCITDGFCASCKESVVPGLPCFCCNSYVEAVFVVESLAPGSLVSAHATPIPGSVDEAIAADDNAFIIVPFPLPHNRAIDVSSLRYERAPTGGHVISGVVILQSNPDASRDLSHEVIIDINGGTTPGGGCGSTQHTIIGYGNFLGNGGIGGPAIFDCSGFCTQACLLGGGGDVNICEPPSVSIGSPVCFCHQICTSRVAGTWQVPVADLNPADIVTVRVVAAPGSLPEIDPTDDVVEVLVSEITVCPADFDGNGVVAVPDIFTFLSAWFAQQPAADFDGNGAIAVPDIFAFLGAWFAGC